MTTPTRPHKDKAAARKVARCDIGRPTTVPMLANTTKLRPASVRPTGRLALAGIVLDFRRRVRDLGGDAPDRRAKGPSPGARAAGSPRRTRCGRFQSDGVRV